MNPGTAQDQVPILCPAIPATFSEVRRSSSSTPPATSCLHGAICGTWRSWGSRGGWTIACRSKTLTTKRDTVTFDRSSLFALVSSAPWGDSTTTPSVYWVENVFEALDTAGQWYLDRPQGWLYYLAKSGEETLTQQGVAHCPALLTLRLSMPAAPQ